MPPGIGYGKKGNMKGRSTRRTPAAQGQTPMAGKRPTRTGASTQRVTPQQQRQMRTGTGSATRQRLQSAAANQLSTPFKPSARPSAMALNKAKKGKAKRMARTKMI